MTRTISLIIGIAVVALVAVPTAFGEGRLAGSPEPDAVAYSYANERATLADQPLVVVSRPDSHEVDPSAGYMDAASERRGSRSRRARRCSSPATTTSPFRRPNRRPRPLRDVTSSGRRSASASASGSLWPSSSGSRSRRRGPAAGSLIRVTHLGPTDRDRPARGGRGVCGVGSGGGRAAAVPQERLAESAERGRQAACEGGSHGTADAPPHRPGPRVGHGLVDAGLDRPDRRRPLARRAVRRPELGQERARGRVGRASARSPQRAPGVEELAPRTPCPCCGSTSAPARVTRPFFGVTLDSSARGLADGGAAASCVRARALGKD